MKEDELSTALGSQFEQLDIEGRYKLLESMSLPDFIIQSVTISGDPKQAGREVYDVVKANAPECLLLLRPPTST